MKEPRLHQVVLHLKPCAESPPVCLVAAKGTLHHHAALAQAVLVVLLPAI